MRSRCSRVSSADLDDPPGPLAEPRRQPGEQDAGDQRDRGQHARARRSAPPRARTIRVPTWNWCEARPSARRTRRVRRCVSCPAAPRRAPRPSAADGSRPGRAGRSARRPRRGSTSPRRRTRRAERLAVRGDLLEVPAERLLALVDAGDDLEPRAMARGAGACRASASSVWRGTGARRRGGTPAAARRGRTPRSRRPARPTRRRESVEFVRRPAEDLGELEDRERPLLDGGRCPRAQVAPELGPQTGQRPLVAERLAGRVSQREPVQEQPDREELVRLSGRAGCGDAVARSSICRTIPPQPRRASSVAARNCVPLRLRNPKRVERFAHRFERPDAGVLEPGSFRRQSAQPASGGAGCRAVDRAERTEEAAFAVRQRPVGDALVEERGAEPDQDVVDRAGRCRPSRPRGAGRGGGPASRAAVADCGTPATPSRQTRHRASRANASQVSSAQVSMPVRRTRAATLAARSVDSQCLRRGGRASPTAASRRSACRAYAAETSGRTRRSASVSATNQRSSSAGPVRSGYWSIASRRSNRVASPDTVPVARSPRSSRAPRAGRRTGCGPCRGRRGTAPRAGTAGSRRLRPPCDGFLERQVLEGVKRVVVDEDGDRPLGRQQVGGVVDGAAEAFLCLGSTIGHVRMGFDRLIVMNQRRDAPVRRGRWSRKKVAIQLYWGESGSITRSREPLPFLLAAAYAVVHRPDFLITRSARHAPLEGHTDLDLRSVACEPCPRRRQAAPDLLRQHGAPAGHRRRRLGQGRPGREGRRRARTRDAAERLGVEASARDRGQGRQLVGQALPQARRPAPATR